MMIQKQRNFSGWQAWAVLAILTAIPGQSAVAQLPGLPAAAPKVPAAEEKSKTTVATTSGPISVHEKVNDHEIEHFLDRFLPQYPGVEGRLDTEVEQGVVKITGRVDNDATRDEITQVVTKVEGVRMVLNQTRTDEEVMSGWEFAQQEAGNFFGYLRRKWILMLLSVTIVAVSWVLAQAFAMHSETLLALVVHNVLLRSVVGSIISGLIILGGLILALAALRLTHAVASVAGVSGLIVLAVGFAFRDITENFIASVLLGLRRPFQIGDYVTIAGQSGVVKSLNTRATVLVTLDGKHVRIPNATIFKEIMVNATASPSFRTNFDVVIPETASTADAIEAMNRALRETTGILADPAPRTLVEGLEPGIVRLRADFWTPTHNIDWFQLISDAKLRAKVALQQAGVIGTPPPPAPTSLPAPADVPSLARSDDRPNGRASAPATNGTPTTPAEAAANLARDAQAADEAPTAVVPNAETPTQRVLQEPETRVSDEGTNLLKNGRNG